MVGVGVTILSGIYAQLTVCGRGTMWQQHVPLVQGLPAFMLTVWSGMCAEMTVCGHGTTSRP